MMESETNLSAKYKRLVIALDSFFEYDTYGRFVTLMTTREDSLKDVDLEPSGWGTGYRLLEEYRRNAERVHGQKNDPRQTHAQDDRGAKPL